MAIGHASTPSYIQDVRSAGDAQCDDDEHDCGNGLLHAAEGLQTTEAIRRALEVHHTTPPPAPMAPPMAATQAYVPSVALPQASSTMTQQKTMDLDALQRVHCQQDTPICVLP